MSLPHLLLVLAAAGLLLAPSARAEDLPRQMTFQGRLVRADGSPETTPQSLRFALYATASGGAPLWEESHPSVAVTNGYYAVVLGASLPLPASVLTGQSLYLGVSLVGQSELTPRLPLVSVPYALRADDSNRLEGRNAASFADASHSHASVPLAENSNLLEGRAASSFANASHTHAAATPTTAGFMAAADKVKLNAQPNSFGGGLALSGGVLSVSFAGNSGNATTAARSDHTHPLSCTFRKATGNTDAGRGATAWCSAGETLLGGGCENLGDEGLTFGPTNVQTQDGSSGTGPAWRCHASSGTTAPTAYAQCCRTTAP